MRVISASVPSIHPASGGAALPIAAFLAIAFAGVLLRPALPVDETRYLAVAWEMHLSGDWLVPTKNFAPYSDKPPLLFWVINLVWSVTGVSETAARMVGPGFAGLALWLTARLAGALWPDVPSIGGRAAWALLALPVFTVMGGLTMFDAALSVAVMSGLLALISAGNGSRAGIVGFGAALALGVLAKGPVVLLHLMPAAILMRVWHPARPGWRRGLGVAVPGLAFGLTLVLLWLVPAAVLGGAEYRRAILWTQSAGRVADSFAHARPWWFFAALLPLIAFPWAWIPRLWVAARKADWLDPGLALCAIWGISALSVFSLISGKQIHYLFPELPAIALVAARLTEDEQVSLRLPALAFAGLVALLFLIGIDVIDVGTLLALPQPQAAVIAVAFLLLAALWTGLARGGLAGGAVLTLGFSLGASLLIGLTDLRERYGTAQIAHEVATHEALGIAWIGRAYSAEFNFAGRLARPVDMPGPKELPAWIVAHPGGAIIGAADRLDPGWPPARRILFRNTIYGVWIVPGRPEDGPVP